MLGLNRAQQPRGHSWQCNSNCPGFALVLSPDGKRGRREAGVGHSEWRPQPEPPEPRRGYDLCAIPATLSSDRCSTTAYSDRVDFSLVFELPCGLRGCGGLRRVRGRLGRSRAGGPGPGPPIDRRDSGDLPAAPARVAALAPSQPPGHEPVCQDGWIMGLRGCIAKAGALDGWMSSTALSTLSGEEHGYMW